MILSAILINMSKWTGNLLFKFTMRVFITVSNKYKIYPYVYYVRSLFYGIDILFMGVLCVYFHKK